MSLFGKDNLNTPEGVHLTPDQEGHVKNCVQILPRYRFIKVNSIVGGNPEESAQISYVAHRLSQSFFNLINTFKGWFESDQESYKQMISALIEYYGGVEVVKDVLNKCRLSAKSEAERLYLTVGECDAFSNELQNTDSRES